MKRVVWLRKTHKWLALLAGIQVLIWSLSGLYMTFVDIDIIHGDHLVKQQTEQTLRSSETLDQSIQPISRTVIEKIAPIQSIRLIVYFGKPVYEVKTDKAVVIVDALSGNRQKTLTKEIIKEHANEIYAGQASIAAMNLLTEYPNELGGRKQPVWQVQYDDWLDSTLYFHPVSGRLVSKRTDLWRAFDFLWVLHIMDYWGSDGITGIIFRAFSLASFLMALFGSWLLVYRLKGGQTS